MNEEMKTLILESVPNQNKFIQFIGRLFDVARPETVYSEPIASGEYTVLTASEVWVSMGAGYGGGGGMEDGSDGDSDSEADGGGAGAGGGGGGGGTSWARPVAAISVGPNGVHVDPIVDPTKLGIAFFTTIGAMFMFLGKMKKAAE